MMPGLGLVLRVGLWGCGADKATVLTCCMLGERGGCGADKATVLTCCMVGSTAKDDIVVYSKHKYA
ncbi:hypothetical protein PF004_g23147 [Phytophthora fragariae]|uniref:Secreted protein n=1 Tax=Phytophthora fragariae TaxID=53985 RepID=A0A6G0MXY9_9STRA|nr:hypothetical protein PF004_g23147 [Phytophthora fragariae]